MRRILLAIAALFAAAGALMAIPARPGRIAYTQPDGTVINITLHGDEAGHWVTDDRGRLLRQDDRGFWRVAPEMSPAQVARAATARRQARRSLRKADRSGMAIGQKRFLVILVEFNDVQFTTDDINGAIYAMLNEQGYSENGGTGSARDYYFENSHGLFEPQFDVYGPVVLPESRAYYGANKANGDDKRPEEAVTEGCKALDDLVDFAEYDHDGDGFVDLVFMYYAGKGEADTGITETIWPHQSELSYAGLTLELDGVSIESYACSNEVEGTGKYRGKLCGIGTVCHEFAHALGLPDFYDTNYEDDDFASALTSFSVMCDGAYNNDGRTPPYFNIEERNMLGWLENGAIVAIEDKGHYDLPPVDNNVAYLTPTEKEGEYFLYECRSKTGWDKYLDGEGLLVYHLDKSDRIVRIGLESQPASTLWEDWLLYNNLNASGKHPCFYIVPAADPTSLTYGYTLSADYYYYSEAKVAGMPFPGTSKVTSFNPVSWDGCKSDFVFSNIAFSGGFARFDVEIHTGEPDYPWISNPEGGVYEAGGEFMLLLDGEAADNVTSVRWIMDGREIDGAQTSVVLHKGSHTIEALVTDSDKGEYTLILEIEVR